MSSLDRYECVECSGMSVTAVIRRDGKAVTSCPDCGREAVVAKAQLRPAVRTDSSTKFYECDKCGNISAIATECPNGMFDVECPDCGFIAHVTKEQLDILMVEV